MVNQAQSSMKQKIWPWLIVISFACIAAATVELVMVNAGNYFAVVTGDLGVTISALTLWMTIVSLVIAFVAPVAGRLYPTHGQLVLAGGLILVLGGSGLMSAYSELWQFYLSGALIGIGGAICFVMPGPIFISNWFAKRSALAIGIYSCLVAILSAIMSPLIAITIQSFGWRSSYLIWAIIGLCISLPWVLFVIKYNPSEKGLVPYGYDPNEPEETKNIAEDQNAPGVPFAKAKVSIAFYLLMLFAGAVGLFGGFRSQLSPMMLEFGFAAVFAALCVSAATLAKLASPIVGALADKFGAYKTTVVVLILMFLGYLGLYFFHVWEPLILLMCFFAGFDSLGTKLLVPAVVRETFGPKNYSKIYSTIFGVSQFICAFQNTLVAWVAETFGGYASVCVFGMILIAFALVMLLLTIATKKKLAWED